MRHSGVDEFPHVTEENLHAALKEMSKHKNGCLMYHAELEKEDVIPEEEKVP